MKGYIHSIETFGMLDGPGIRVVVFLQGCALRCAFCHNPDSWNPTSETVMTPEELLKFVQRYKSYFKDTGGVTFSGGEPLFQSEFLLECLKLLKEDGIHTCLDTSGVGNNNYAEILKYTDLVIYDIKALNDNDYEELVNFRMNRTEEFIKLCQSMEKSLWLRQVIIPGYNDNLEYIDELAAYIKTIQFVEKVELLPYHTKGVGKYKELNIPYPLTDVPDMDIDKCKDLENTLNKLVNS